MEVGLDVGIPVGSPTPASLDQKLAVTCLLDAALEIPRFAATPSEIDLDSQWNVSRHHALRATVLPQFLVRLRRETADGERRIVAVAACQADRNQARMPLIGLDLRTAQREGERRCEN